MVSGERTFRLPTSFLVLGGAMDARPIEPMNTAQ